MDLKQMTMAALLEQIELSVCYGLEENTDAQGEMLKSIGELVREVRSRSEEPRP